MENLDKESGGQWKGLGFVGVGDECLHKGAGLPQGGKGKQGLQVKKAIGESGGEVAWGGLLQVGSRRQRGDTRDPKDSDRGLEHAVFSCFLAKWLQVQQVSGIWHWNALGWEESS